MEQNVYIVHFFIMFALSLISFRFSYKILKQNLSSKTLNLPPLVIVYFVFIFLESFFAFLLYFYSIILWRPDIVIYDGRILIILGFCCGFFFFLHPILEIFLCIDRCLTILFPLKYKYRIQNVAFIIKMIALTLISTALLIQVYVINTFPTTSTTTCRVYYCLGFFIHQSYSMIVKMSISAVSIICSLTLGVIIKRHLGQNSTLSIRRMNFTVLIMIISSVCLDFLPNIIGQIFQSITERNLLDFIGPYTLICGTLNITLCSGIYYRALKASNIPNFVSTAVSPLR